MQKVNEGNMNSLRESGLMLAFFFFPPRESVKKILVADRKPGVF